MYEFITFKAGADWIGNLWKRLMGIQGAREKELEYINTIIYGDPLDIARNYVEPDCQDRNPADDPAEDDLLSKTPVMDTVDKFFRKKSIREGDNQMFFLSDAGMGKTSLLTMVKLMHLTAFLPKDNECVLKKLGEKTVEELGAVEGKRKTILLLDSLDEDPCAYGRVEKRLLEILDASRDFFKVIVTCRTQFFPNVEDNLLNRLGKVSLGGYYCSVKYLSLFDDEKVRAYLQKRYPKKYWLFPNKMAAEAETIIQKMGRLRCRPMLLAYIGDLMEPSAMETGDTEYGVYDALVKSWLDRERIKKKEISPDNLLKACTILATYMLSNNMRAIPVDRLDRLIEKIATVRPVKNIEIKGRSLINRNSQGDYQFSHRSIQEFLVAKQLLEKTVAMEPRSKVPVTDFMLKMMSIQKKKPEYIEWLDFKSVKLSGQDLRGLQLPGADLSGSDLSGADLSGADFAKSNLSGGNLSGCDLSGADISGTKVEACQFENTKLAGAKCKGVCFQYGILKADLSGCDFEGACVENGLGMKFVFIPPGSFLMGSPEGEPGRYGDETQHEVTLTRGFFMQTTPVTRKQWRTFATETNCKDDFEYNWKCKAMAEPEFAQEEDHPVCCVSWNEVRAFIEWLNRKEGVESYDLPTEAQWEYACRAGTQTAWFFGNEEKDLERYAWFEKNSGDCTRPVGKLGANPWGLHDMHGNVWEWCKDWRGDYSSDPATDPQGPETGSRRVVRGGSWYDSPRHCRAAYRSYDHPGYRLAHLGFRLVLLPGRSAS